MCSIQFARTCIVFVLWMLAIYSIGNIYNIIFDNALSNDSAISYLKTIINDWNSYILENEFLHMTNVVLT